METNTFYSKKNDLFYNACKMAGIPNTSRQASKFRRGMGLAYKVSTKQVEVLKDDNGNFVRIVN